MTTRTAGPHTASQSSDPARAARAGDAPRDFPAAGGARRSAAVLGAATFFVMIPVTLIVPPLKELVADRYAAGPFWTHVFMSCNLIGAVLASPLIAAVCDRSRSRTRVVALALLADAALLGAMALARNLPLLLAARTVEGAAHMLALSALMALAADQASPTRRGRVMGVLGACLMLGTAAGIRLGGLIWRLLPGWSFQAAALAALLAALFAAAAVRDTADHERLSRLRDFGRLLRRAPGLLVAAAFAFVDRFCVGVIISSFVLFLATVHGLSPDHRSRLLVLFLVPFALLVYPAGRLVDRVGPVAPLAVGSVAFGLLMAAYGFVPVAWLPAVMLASGVLSAVMFAPTLALGAALAPPGQRGTAYAAFNAAGSLGFLAGPIVGGLLGAALGGPWGERAAYRAAFVAAGLAQWAVVLATLPLLLHLRRAGRLSARSPQRAFDVSDRSVRTEAS